MAAFFEHSTNSLWLSGLAVSIVCRATFRTTARFQKSRRGVLKKECQIRFVNSEISGCSEGRVLKTHSPRHRAYIDNNREFIPNFGERYRQGERITTSFVESTINQVVSRRFVKKQQMAWTLRGAHLLLQTRTKVLNNELEEVRFERRALQVPSMVSA